MSTSVNLTGGITDPLKDANLGGEMASIPFTAIIGGAFKAVVDAQAQASLTTINFIQSAGFKPASDGNKSHFGEPVMVQFKYTQPAGSLGAMTRTSTVRVPLLTILPVPHLRVDTMTVVFNVKLTQTRTADLNNTYNSASVQTTNSSTDIKGGPETVTTAQGTTGNSWSGGWTNNNQYQYNWTSTGFREGYTANTNWSQSTNMVGTVQNQSTNRQGMQVNREYSLKVEISAVSDRAPAGLERIIDILTNAIGKKPAGTNDLASQAIANAVGTGGSTGQKL